MQQEDAIEATKQVLAMSTNVHPNPRIPMRLYLGLWTRSHPLFGDILRSKPETRPPRNEE